MNKIIIKILIFFLILGVNSCTYEPIFSEKNYNFEINQIIFSGEKEINKIIENKFKLIRNKQNLKVKKYNLEIFSTKERKEISKDSKGDPLKFEMIILVEFKVTQSGNLILQKEIKKNNIYNNDNDLFQLERSERNIIQNISSNISDIIFSSIINLNDN